ncbi:MAG TPA: PAS domain S-box protein [Anaerolineales bacterium]|nr:PAS domain S-box protein [Anaerolineales bacterium]
MYLIPILAVSALLQLFAATLALRLIHITGGLKVWVTVAIGMALMALRSALVLYQIVSGTPGINLAPISEVIALVASLVLIPALAWIGPHLSTATHADPTFQEPDALFHQLADAAFEGIAITEDGCFIEATHQFASLFGYQRRELIGKQLAEFLAPEARKEALEKNRGGYDRPYGSVGMKRDGTRFQIDVSGKSYSHRDRNLRVTVVRDISQRKQAEEEINRLKEFNENILLNMFEGILVEDRDGYFTLVNPSAAALLGYTREEIEGQHWTITIPEDQYPIVEAADQRRSAGDSDRYELEILHRNGHRIPVQVSGSPLFENGDFVGTMAVFMDLTARRRQENEQNAIATLSAALRTAADREKMMAILLDQMENLLSANGAAIALLEPERGETVIASACSAWAEWKGERLPAGAGVSGKVIESGELYTSEDIISDPLFARPELLGEISALICVPLIAHEETLGALLLGREYPFDESEIRIMTAIADMAASAIRRATLMETLEIRVRERTIELEEANEQLKELDRLKSSFVSNVSHELRTPITNVILYLDLLRNPLKAGKRDVYMGVLQNEAERLSTLIEDLLTLSRLDSEVGSERKELHVMDALITEVIDSQHARAEAKNILLQHELNPEVPAVVVSREQMIQVVTNLVGNALSYTQSGGHVLLSSERVNTRKEPQIAIRVYNNGPEIPPEDRAHLFERFYRGRTGRDSGEPGTGLGLAICKEIVERHRGWIEVESDAEHGTSFEIFLPLHERTVNPAAG